MFTIYVYVLDTLADWEIGYVTAELKSGRFFKEDAPSVSLKTVSDSKEPVHTMGGLTIVPDCLVEDIVVSKTSVLLLPGANTWNAPSRGAIMKKSKRISIFWRCGMCNLWGYRCTCRHWGIESAPAYQQWTGIS